MSSFLISDYIGLFYLFLYHIIFYQIKRYYIILYQIILYHIVLFHFYFSYIILQYIILNYIILYCAMAILWSLGFVNYAFSTTWPPTKVSSADATAKHRVTGGCCLATLVFAGSLHETSGFHDGFSRFYWVLLGFDWFWVGLIACFNVL